ncbi:hypothetical protein NLU13_7091 [Sarocladium strictum]|uniref:DUF7918 domain-containing protein n=1 Tax=Sarocladium strictum TaxID=5046 RepID=A0AA39GF79_SARSR|nr:hypothetical protein NLU13_7091 [Sarocladium strictum]
MAILPDVPGIEVRVKVEGELVPDYENTDVKAEALQPPNHPTRHFYVESKTGARYCVQLDMNEEFAAYLEKHHDGAKHLRIELLVDGVRSAALCCRNVLEYRTFRVTSDLKHYVKGPSETCTYRDLVFTQIQGVEATSVERIRGDAEKARRIGLIQVIIHVGSDGTTPYPSSPVTRDELHELCSDPQVLELAEKSMKGSDLTHCSSLHNETKTKMTRSFCLKTDKTMCEFQFFYRSKETLQSLEVIAHPEPRMPEFSNMTRQELLAFAERNWRNLGDEADRKPLHIKTEPCDGNPGQGPIDLTVTRKRKRVEIDLTED